MRKSKIATKITGIMLSAVMMLGLSAPALASDFTEDSNTTIPINATVEGSYKISLPAAIDHFEKLKDGFSGTTDVMQLWFPITVDFTQLPGKGLYMTYDEVTVTNGTDSFKVNAGNSLIIAPGTTLDTSNTNVWDPSTIPFDIALTIPSYDERLTTKIDTVRTSSGSFLTDVENVTQALLWKQDAATVGSGNNLKVPDSGAYVTPKTLPVGAYTGSLNVSWSLKDINPDLLN